MGRPSGDQWRPLGLSTDPVPGDPEAIFAQAARLNAQARTITSQTGALRKIASDGTETGQHADQIRAAAAHLATSLEAVAGRYTKVAAALTAWAPELAEAQALSLRALNEAEAPYAQLATATAAGGPAIRFATAGPAPQDAAAAAARAHAEGQLDAAYALLARAISQRDSEGGRAAARITAASEDALTDHVSFWDRFAWVIKDVCTDLELVAAVAAGVAFVLAQFIPVADVIIDALAIGAFAATAAATAGRGTLAATGNGSWWDLGVDAFACLTFGEGRFLGVAARVIADQAEAVSGSAITAELISGTGAKATELARFAAMTGQDVTTLASRYAPRLAQTAVRAAVDGHDLAGAWKVHSSIGLLPREAEQFSRALAVTARFAADTGRLELVTKGALAAAGIGPGIGSAAGAGALAGGGFDVEGPDGHTVIDLHFGRITRWYTHTFEAPTGG